MVYNKFTVLFVAVLILPYYLLWYEVFTVLFVMVYRTICYGIFAIYRTICYGIPYYLLWYESKITDKIGVF